MLNMTHRQITEKRQKQHKKDEYKDMLITDFCKNLDISTLSLAAKVLLYNSNA